MPARALLIRINIVLVAIFIGILLGCGGDPEAPPKGSIQEKLCGEWASHKLSNNNKDGDSEIDFVEVEISHWNVGLIASCKVVVANNGKGPTGSDNRHSASDFTYSARTATSGRSHDDSTWVFRLDPNDTEVMYVTWVLKDGTKRLDEVKFHRTYRRY